jgi:hypothetical protein
VARPPAIAPRPRARRRGPRLPTPPQRSGIGGGPGARSQHHKRAGPPTLAIQQARQSTAICKVDVIGSRAWRGFRQALGLSTPRSPCSARYAVGFCAPLVVTRQAICGPLRLACAPPRLPLARAARSAPSSAQAAGAPRRKPSRQLRECARNTEPRSTAAAGWAFARSSLKPAESTPHRAALSPASCRRSSPARP